MRIRQFGLIRYGHFTDVTAEFLLTSNTPDIHVILGDNEAGKSTMLSAVEDFLFGIPRKSSMNFVHPYRKMRIGAILERDGEARHFIRRKGRKNTLLNADGLPDTSGESTLRKFLGEMTREQFGRMFCFDHERLRSEGEDIVRAGGDIGEALFSASSGLEALRSAQQSLNKRATGIWAPRRAKHRTFYQAQDRLNEATTMLREHVVTAEKWLSIRRKYHRTRKEYFDLNDAIANIKLQLIRFNRIRRVHKWIIEFQKVEELIANLGEMKPVPQNAKLRLRYDEQQIFVANDRIKQLSSELKELEKQRKELEWDRRLIQRKDEIQRLHDFRIEINKEKSDLPKRQAELEAAQNSVVELAQRAGWRRISSDSLISNLPTTANVKQARDLYSEGIKVQEAVKAARKALDDSVRILEIRDRDLAQFGELKDLSQLHEVLKTIQRDESVLISNLRSQENQASSAQTKAESHLRRLDLPVSLILEAATLPVPSRIVVEEHLDKENQLNQLVRESQNRCDNLRKNLKGYQTTREKILEKENPVSPAMVAELRRRRDSIWELIRDKFIYDLPVDEEETEALLEIYTTFPEAYESAVSRADHAVDRSLETANAAAQLEQIEKQIQQFSENLKKEESRLNAFARDLEQLSEKWRSLWAEVPIEPRSPREMLGWLDTHGKLREEVDRHQEHKATLDQLQQRQSSAVNTLTKELEAAGITLPPGETERLSVLIQKISSIIREYVRNADKLENMRKHRDAFERQVEGKREALRRANKDSSIWRKDWTAAVEAVGLDSQAVAIAVEAQLEIIESIRREGVRIRELRDQRIAKIHRDIRDFEESVSEFVSSAASDLSDTEASEATLVLERRLEDAQTTQKQAANCDRQIRTLLSRLSAEKRNIQDAERSIHSLLNEAGVESTEELLEEIKKGEDFEQLKQQHADVRATLNDNGDGLTIEKLTTECKNINLDELAVKQAALQDKIDDLDARRLIARDNYRDAEQEFKEVGHDDRAAIAEGKRQSALTEMREVTQEYVRVRTVEILIKWVIERNRREKQGPIMKAAGNYFKTLTLGSFEALEADFDKKDRIRLVGRRESGERVGVDGMSSGTIDQLFLALRIAALSEHLSTGHPLPFIADDLFINFDDLRSSAGLKVLANLATKTQVLFFTHHEHLVRLAEEAIKPYRVNVWRMGN